MMCEMLFILIKIAYAALGSRPLYMLCPAEIMVQYVAYCICLVTRNNVLELK